ncbi:MAG: sialidase family protein [Acidobacteriota bacterium]
MRASTHSLRLALTILAVSAPLAWAASVSRPTLESQLAAVRAPKASALESFIRANQDFSALRPDEALDRLPIPLWLRSAWRKSHPEGNYTAANPAGGYPFVLKEAVEWMRHHPNLAPGAREADVAEPALRTSAGANVLISGPGQLMSESDIRINFKNPQQIIGAANNLGGSGHQAQFYSSTGGATWGQTTLPLPAGDAFNSDPTVDWTSDGVAWSTSIGINSGVTTLRIRSFRSTDGGATWKLDGTVSGNHTSADKQIQWVDHSATSPFKDNIYVIWHNDDPAYVNRRTATGWKTPQKVSGAETTGTAIGGDVKTNSAGHVFAFWPTTGNRKVLVAKSTNGGATFARPVQIATTFDGYDIGVPSFVHRRALIYLSGGAYKTAAKNNVYAAWTDLTGAAGCNSPANEPGNSAASACKTRIWFSRSTDGGATWSAPKMINNRAGKTDQFNQWLAVDETNGRIGVIYYDTVGEATRRTTNVWYQSSANDGTTWSVPLKVTTGRTDETGSGAELGNQYGDYNSLSGFMGKFFPSWTDRRGGSREGIWTAPIADP